MAKRIVIIILSLIGTAVIFQNCSNAQFDFQATQQKLAFTTDDSDAGTDTTDTPVNLPPPVDSKPEDQIYVCVLAGNGKSVKAAYFNAELTEHISTPGDVCMTKNACLNIVSQIFDVQEAAYRGFCPNKNPHVFTMSDAQVKAIVDKMKKP